MALEKSSFFKKFALFLICFLSLTILLILFLPTYLSTSSGTRFLSSRLSKSLSAKVEIDSAHLSWTSGQKIEGIVYNPHDGLLTFTCKEIYSSASLWQILLPSHDVGQLQVIEPTLSLHQTLIAKPQKIEAPVIQASSLLAAIDMNEFVPEVSLPLIGELKLVNGAITIISKEIPSIVFTKIQANYLANKDLENGKLHATGNTKQNDIEGSFFIDTSFLHAESLNRSFQGKIKLENFPTEGADQLIALKNPKYRFLLTSAIGPWINMNSEFALSPKEINISLDSSSSNMKAHFETVFDGNSIELAAPGLLKLQISAAFSQKLSELFPSIATFLSDSPFNLSLSVNSLSIPKKETIFQFEETAFNAKLTIDPYSTKNGVNLGSIAALSSQNLSKDISGQFQLTLQNALYNSTSSGSIVLKNPLMEEREINASVNLSKIPTSFLDPLFKLPLSTLVGSWMQGNINCVGTDKNLLCSLDLETPLLLVKGGSFALESEKLKLGKPLQMTYKANPFVLESLLGKEKIALKTETIIQATLLDFDLEDISKTETLKMKMHMDSPSIFFGSLMTLKNYQLQNLSCDIETNTLSQIHLDLKSDQIQTDWNGSIDLKTRSIYWDKTFQIHVLVTQEMLENNLPKDARAKLQAPAPVVLHIDPAVLSQLSGFDQIKASGKLTAEKMIFEKIQLQAIEAGFQLMGVKDAAALSFSTSLIAPSLPAGTLSGLINIERLSTTPLTKASLKLQNFPLLFVDSLLGQPIPLAQVLGASLNLDLAFDQSLKETSFFIQGQSPNLQIKGAFNLTPQGLFLNPKTPLDIQYVLTPGAYLVMHQGPANFFLESNTLFKASVSKLVLPRIPNTPLSLQNLDFINGNMEAFLQNDQMILSKRESEEKVSLSATSISIQKKDASSPLALTLDTTTSSSLSSQKGSVRGDMTFANFLTQTGINFSDIKSNIQLSFRNFPSSILDITASTKERRKQTFSALLGPTFDSQIKASIGNGSGPLSLELSSKNAKFSLKGALNSGVFTLQENLTAEFMLTNESSKFFLNEVNPLSLKSLTSLNPLTLQVAAKGFSLPVTPYTPSQIQMPNVKIQLGKILCQNEGNINSMLGVLKSKQFAQKKQLELWFAPLDLHIQNGVIDLERTEILVADTYDMALWGKISLPANRVNMILGLTASCLKKAFGLKDLPPDYVMHVPLTGTLDNVKLDTGQASAKVVALTLWQNQATGAVKGIGGALLGGVLNKVLAPPNEGNTPPAKTPFPWQQRSSGY